MTERLVLALPSKGRLMEETEKLFADAGLPVRRVGHARGYRGEIEGLPNVEVAFVSASEIAERIKSGKAHLGVTGEDLVAELVPAHRAAVTFLKALSFGHANVIVGIPAAWIDVVSMASLERAAVAFRRQHGRHMRVATKYGRLTRSYFADMGVSTYRIVPSLGATEGAPAMGTAELIVDITTTGKTLEANGLKVLETILKSEANLVASKAATWPPEVREAENILMKRLGIM
ncbi:MAG TPA: ATP phosphoribosyltransferase [Hyphomicrobiaceae bacterium]|nr:ATP phosphoribosyltransferase [Hyphomicrobiaceae bacterium]